MRKPGLCAQNTPVYNYLVNISPFLNVLVKICKFYKILYTFYLIGGKNYM